MISILLPVLLVLLGIATSDAGYVGGGVGNEKKPSTQPRCISSDGRVVDWWLLLKYPSGEEAALLDSSSLGQQQRRADNASAGPSASSRGTGKASGQGRLDPSSDLAAGSVSAAVMARRALRGGSSATSPAGTHDNPSETSCNWRSGFNVNDPDGPLRATLAAAVQGAAQPDAAAAVKDAGDTAAGATGREEPAEQVQAWTARRLKGALAPDVAARSAVTGRQDPGAAGAPATRHGLDSAATASNEPTEAAYVFYNDADPEGVEHWGFAHAKGALLFGPEGGAWITHSFPRYPGRPPRRGGSGATRFAGNYSTDVTGLTHGPSGSGDSDESGAWDVVQHPQTVFGQHALCLTLPRGELLRVARSLLVARAFVYEHSVSEDVLRQYDVVRQLIEASEGDSRTSASAPGENAETGLQQRQENVSRYDIVTSGGTAWLHVAKSPNYTVPFHEQVLEPLLGAGMAWETWRVGKSYPSECPPDTPFGSLNVRSISVPLCPRRTGLPGYGVGAAAAARAGAGAAPARQPRTQPVDASDVTSSRDGAAAVWDSLKDHSKWGISTAGLCDARAVNAAAPLGVKCVEAAHADGNWVCIGDLNRQPSQRFRGGGFVCTRDAGLWESFRTLVAEVEPCSTGLDAASEAGSA